MRASAVFAKAWGGDVAQGQPGTARARQGKPAWVLVAPLGAVSAPPPSTKFSDDAGQWPPRQALQLCSSSRLFDFEKAELVLHELSPPQRLAARCSLAELCRAVPVTNPAICQWGQAWSPTTPVHDRNRAVPIPRSNLDAQAGRGSNSRIKTFNSSRTCDLAPDDAAREAIKAAIYYSR